jgi:hypothetical protein
MYTYDVSNNLKETLAQVWNRDYEQWVNEMRLTYTYNAQNKLIEYVDQMWLGQWYNYEKVTFTYNEQNNMDEKLIQKWYGQWENSFKYSYVYNLQNNLSEELMQWWGNSTWEILAKYIYIYDVQNKLIEKQEHVWNSDSEEWRIIDKWIYTYDAQNNRTEELYQQWAIEWENEEKMTYSYDENNNANAGVFQKWGNDAWHDWNGYLNLYYNKMQSNWNYINLCKFTATYIKPKEISIQENRVENEIKIYPNPTTGELTIDNGQLTINNIEVFDVYGRKCHVSHVTCHDIDISHLPIGVYIVKIDGVCRKVVKQ